MAIVKSGEQGQLRGKLGRIVYAQQPDGTITARSVGERSGRTTPGEQKGQHRMKLGNAYVHAVLGDPALKAVYAAEALARQMRTCDCIMADFLTDPVISSLDTSKYNGLGGGTLLILTGDDFKVIQVQLAFRDATGQLLEQGPAEPAQGSKAKVWIYTARQTLPAGQTLAIELTATDRPGNSTVLSVSHPI